MCGCVWRAQSLFTFKSLKALNIPSFFAFQEPWPRLKHQLATQIRTYTHATIKKEMPSIIRAPLSEPMKTAYTILVFNTAGNQHFKSFVCGTWLFSIAVVVVFSSYHLYFSHLQVDKIL